MLMMRFGAAGHGLSFYEPFGLRWLGPEQVEEWSRRWLTRGNAAMWMTHPPPAGLRLDLPDGPRVPPPEPRALPELELPAFAAAGEGEIASSMVARRSAAVAAAGRTVAARLGGATTWQFPLTAELSHRFLTVPERDGALAELVAVYDSVAADGPTRDELAEATGAAIDAVCAHEAVAGNLERMAVDELLGAPRRWKEELIDEAKSVSYAEVAAALREAMTNQILLAPANAASPSDRFHAFPWFSLDRIEGMPLRSLKRGQGVRLVVSQEGVSHVADETGRASTVRFADVAAALQEPDGSLTLLGSDGAIVPIDPHAFKGAGQVVADLEQRLPPELVVPPRESGRIEQVARRKLRPGVPVAAELQLLRDRVGHEEQVVTLCQAVVGFKWGLLALTDQRVVWVHHGPRDPMVRELPYRDVLAVKLSRIPSLIVTVTSPAGETAFSQIQPKERATEIVEEIRRRTAAQ
jgi:zinc protease